MKKILNSLVALIIWPIILFVFGISISIYILFSIFIPPRRLYWLTKILCWLILLGAGQILVIKGKVPNAKNGPHLYLFNHQSYLDPFMLGASLKEFVSAVGGAFQFDWPLWGKFLKRYGAIPIIREDLSKAIHSLSLSEAEIKKGISFIISPEGTRTNTGKMLPFKKGPFHVALNTGVTIIPVGIKGAYRAYRRFDWRIYPGVISIKYGEPISYDSYKNMSLDELREYLYEKISDLCDDDMIEENEI